MQKNQRTDTEARKCQDEDLHLLKVKPWPSRPELMGRLGDIPLLKETLPTLIYLRLKLSSSKDSSTQHNQTIAAAVFRIETIWKQLTGTLKGRSAE